MKNIKSKVILTLVTALALTAGCAKKKDLKNEVRPDAYVAKNVVEGKTFALVRGIVEADSENPFYAVPGFHLDFGTVRGIVTENELQFVAVGEADNRPETATIVAAYPITQHFDIIREVNDFGEETNRIVEDSEKKWNQRKYIRVAWSSPTVKTAQVTNSLWALGSMSEENVTLKEELKNEDGHLSFLTESSISYSSRRYGDSKRFRVAMRTHFMPIEASDFKAREYTDQEFSKFGYFRTYENYEDPFKGVLDTTVKKYANVFNVCEAGRKEDCSTNKIVYFLNKGFPEEYKAATRAGVKMWNLAFQKALNRKDDVVVLDESRAVDIVDPRVNTIAFYDPKTRAGLLGVSQTVNNPKTGETITARTTVYGDGVRGSMGVVDEIVDLMLADPEFFKNTGRDIKADIAKAIVTGRSGTSSLPLNESLKLSQKIAGQEQQLTRERLKIGLPINWSTSPVKIASQAVTQSSASPVKASERRSLLAEKAKADIGGIKELSLVPEGLGLALPFMNKENDPVMKGMEHLLMLPELRREERQQRLRMAALGIHAYDYVDEAVARFVERFVLANKGIKDAATLKAELKKVVAQHVYLSTLLHEMGHNFGLRHNFIASSDKPNYQPQYFELLKRFESGDSSVTYEDLTAFSSSSVMDYSAGFASEPNQLGPYDVAAIRYGYNRSIDKDCGDGDCDAVMKANFKFCTDHDLGEDPLCRQFDRGSNVTEVTANTIDRFHKNYILSHFRRDRANFNGIAMSLPMSVMSYYMIPTRQVMDEFVFQLVFGEEDLSPNAVCGKKFMSQSVQDGEIANVCDPNEAEAAGVNPLEMSTFAQGLINPANGQLRKPVYQYKAGGLADFIMANAIAQDFFAKVIGATEAGDYLLNVSMAGPSLSRLPDGETDDLTEACGETNLSVEDKLRLLAKLQEVPGEQVDQFIADNMKRVIPLPISQIAKKYGTKVCREGDGLKIERWGFKMSKIVALYALGMRDLGIFKYQRFSIAGNAYLWPQSKDFTEGLFRSVILNQAQNILSIPISMGNSGVVPVPVRATLDLDTQVTATLVGLMDFVSEQNSTFADQLRICDVNDARCQGEGIDKVSAKTSSGSATYTAAQTIAGDSISYQLVSQLKQVAESRDEIVKKKSELSQNIETSKKGLKDMEKDAKELEKVMRQDPDLAPFADALFSTDQQNPGAVMIASFYLENIARVPTFVGLNTSQELTSRLNQAAQAIATKAQKLGVPLPNPGETTKPGPQAVPTDKPVPFETEEIKNVKRAIDLLNVVGPQIAQAAELISVSLVAPIQIERTTGEMQSQEGMLRFVQRVMRILE